VLGIYLDHRLTSRRLALDDVLAAVRAGGVATELLCLGPTTASGDPPDMERAGRLLHMTGGLVLAAPQGADGVMPIRSLLKELARTAPARPHGRELRPCILILGGTGPALRRRLAWRRQRAEYLQPLERLGFRLLHRILVRERPDAFSDGGTLLRIRAGGAGQHLASLVTGDPTTPPACCPGRGGACPG